MISIHSTFKVSSTFGTHQGTHSSSRERFSRIKLMLTIYMRELTVEDVFLCLTGEGFIPSPVQAEKLGYFCPQNGFIDRLFFVGCSTLFLFGRWAFMSNDSSSLHRR